MSKHGTRITLTSFAVVFSALLIMTAHCFGLLSKPGQLQAAGRFSFRHHQPPTPSPTPGGIVIGGKNLVDWQLYTDPNSSAASQAATWRTSRPADAARMDYLAKQPSPFWLLDSSSQYMAWTQEYIQNANAAHALPTIVIYNLPGRDCGSFSAGGASSDSAYKTWIRSVATMLGQQPAVVVLEPDALPELGECFSASEQTAKLALLADAVTVLKQDKQLLVYMDAGHSRWQSANTMAQRLNAAGVSQADGFSLNVSNFVATPEILTYGQQISSMIGGKHFVVDTSRNGNGSAPDDAWCNPPGRALGQAPTLKTGQALVDAYLWVKVPGESDGECNQGNPPSGDWWPEYALDLAINAGL